MPVITRRNDYRSDLSFRPLVQRLIEELDGKPASSTDLGPPMIVEDYVSNSDRFSVLVVWASWMDVPGDQRSKIILDAYAHSSSRKGHVTDINAVIGLTQAESTGLGIEVP